ncbi:MULTISPECIES: hypothetical protein [Methanosarcina]|uniref:Uncharacterized protein n=1 Tax=Methanosarcina barkeri CM1 TaxID=796385 RepID=A0A0G3CAW6_METBA|nr:MULTISPECIES: hypothetical protein [Methanosarcina]AKJ37840.1 hypothetical protein MCM1_0760 [Methanosarcina barkeri CM1]OEC90632.1 hypothetical protein A9239_04450 [Methanosarcina sp. A14]
MDTESLRTYNKIEPSSFSIKDRIIQIIEFSALLLWLVVYAIRAINFNEYENGTLIDDGSLIKAILFLAAFSFTVSILLGTWTYYKIKRVYSNDPSDRITNIIVWFTLGLVVLTISLPLISFPESDKLFAMYLILLLYAGKYVTKELLKKIEN